MMNKNIYSYFKFDLKQISLKFLTSNFLKIIAVITMFIDHMGFFIWNGSDYIILRQIGRLSFVIYAFLSALAINLTSKKVFYLIKILVLAFILQLFLIFISSQWSTKAFHLNIFFTIFFGTIIIYLINKHWFLGLIGLASVLLFYFFYYNFKQIFNITSNKVFSIEYGLYGLAIIFVAGLSFYFRKITGFLLFKIIFCITFIIIALLFHYTKIQNIYFASMWNISSIQIYALITLPIFLFYNIKDHCKNAIIKWSFALAYPLSFLLPTIILMFMN